jgi:hypothetical protein
VRRVALTILIPLLVAGCERTGVWGASIEAQVDGTSINDNDGMTWHTQNGATTAYWVDAIIKDFHESEATAVVGSANISDAIKDGGWDGYDEAVWSWLIMSAQPDDCVAVVLPWVGASAELAFPGILAEINQARAWLEAHVDNLVDWRPVVEAEPTLLADDGIHLASQAAVAARHALIVEAEALC